jgi:hypothetical protein
MKVLKYIIPLAACVLLFSCEEEENVTFKNTDPKIVLNALVGTDSIITANVFKSSGINSKTENKNLNDAEVVVYENDNIIGEMTFIADGKYELKNDLLKASSDYEIRVNHANCKPVNAESKSLNRILIDNVSTSNTEADKLNFSIQFADNPDETNYYMILLFAYPDSQTPVRHIMEFNSNDIVYKGNLIVGTNSANQGLLDGSKTFSDETFNGSSVNISFFLLNQDNFINASKFVVQLYHITEDYFNYERSYISIQNRDDLPFYNKTNLFSNVNNGYGIFATYAVDEKVITVQ